MNQSATTQTTSEARTPFPWALIALRHAREADALDCAVLETSHPDREESES